MIDLHCRLFDARCAPGIDADELERLLAPWLEQLSGKGPSHVVAHAHTPGERALTIRAAQAHPDRFTALGAVDPGAPDDVAEVLRALDAGELRGIALHPSVAGFDLADPAVAELLSACQPMRALVVVRTGLPPAVLRDAAGVRWNLRGLDPLGVVPLADRFPDLTFVLPSYGGGFLREALMVGALCDNVLLDTTPPAWLALQASEVTLEDVLERTLAVYGADRLCFATGSTSASPGWRGDLATVQREALGALEVRARDCARILDGNARALLGR